ncbi:MAG: MipA/OmpV family protein [Fusobacterium sp.]|nr:MipA/OmpV family protein [Fusobacterium sp.]
MKKRYLLVFMGIIATSAFANSISVGGSISKQSGLYKGSEDTNYLPYINAKIEDFYFAGTELGYKFYNSDVLDLTVYSNLYDGHSIKGSNMNYGYKTINKREKQITIGAKLEAPLYILGETINFSTSLEGGKRGIHGALKLSKTLKVFENFVLVPNINSKYFSKDYTRYYFGVEKDELGGAIRNTYTPDNAFTIGTGIYAEYYFNRAFSLFGYANIYKYSDEVRKSPIIKNDVVTNVGFGARYTF